MVKVLRRAAGFLLLAASGVGAGVLAERVTRPPAPDRPVELAWEQLVPRRGWSVGAAAGAVLRGVVQHGQVAATPGPAPDDAELVKDHDGRRVRIAGYLVPIGFDGVGVREFLLVPYVGACIHVPPPPPNQIIDVRSEEGVEIRGMFDAVQVTGTLAVGALPTELAEVGYRITADAVTADAVTADAVTADAVTADAAERPRSAFERYLSRRP
jgi:uncharacterized protein